MADAAQAKPELFVIEAPGKAKQLEALLAGLGIEARVQATKGHLFTMPDKLTPLGIDRAMREFARVPRDLAVVQRLRDEVSTAARVYVATDADAEGDVIAWDVAELIRDIHPEPVRVRLRGMDQESIKEALAEAKPVSKDDAIPGRTRAIIDRMIGAAFSRDGVAVGRVGTALLGAVASQKPSVHKLRLAAPAKDGGRPWTAETDAKDPITKQVADRLASLALPALDFAAASKPMTPPPGNMGDIMVRAGDRLGMSPKEAATSMQRSYESGRLSYPRAGSRGLSRGAMGKIAKLLKQSGYKFDEGKLVEKPAGAVHDAPYPIGKVNVSNDPERLGQDEGLRTMVARDLVKSGQEHKVELAGTAPLVSFLMGKGFSEEVTRAICGLHWKREQGPRYPGQESWASSEVIARRPDTVVLEVAVKAGLGRPSTWANHVESFMNRGLVDEALGLTAKGREWLAASPAELVDPRMSAAIENACERIAASKGGDPSREPWEVLAEKIVAKLPGAIQEPLLASVRSEPPRPKVDVIVDYGLATTVEEELQRRAANVLAPPSD
jgi:DNA topoisomerase-1